MASLGTYLTTVRKLKTCQADLLEKVAINAVNKDIFPEIALKEDKALAAKEAMETKIPLEEEKIKNAILADSTDIFPEIALKEDNKEDNNKDLVHVSNVERKDIEL